jgi:hypothetical protein
MQKSENIITLQYFIMWTMQLVLCIHCILYVYISFRSQYRAFGSIELIDNSHYRLILKLGKHTKISKIAKFGCEML